MLEDWANIDRSDPGTFLIKIAGAVSARIGGTSGPIWGTAMLRAGTPLRGLDEFTYEDVVRGSAGVPSRASRPAARRSSARRP